MLWCHTALQCLPHHYYGSRIWVSPTSLVCTVLGYLQCENDRLPTLGNCPGYLLLQDLFHVHIRSIYVKPK